MATSTAHPITFDLINSKEFEDKIKVKIHAKAHAQLNSHEYNKSLIPQVGSTLNAVAKVFDKCYIKQFPPDKSPLGVLSVILVKYIDVRGKFSLAEDQIKYAPLRTILPEGIPIIRQTYFEKPLAAFHRFHTHMIQDKIHPDLLKILVTPWADAHNMKLKAHTPTTIILNGKIHTAFLHAVILLKTSMREKKGNYPGLLEEHCYFISRKEFPKFLNYLDNVADTYLAHQTDQILAIKDRFTMKQFYKHEFMANMAVFGSLTLCLLIYLIYPRFGWWNITLILLGLGAGLIMGGIFGRLSYISHRKKQEVISEGFRELSPTSKSQIKQGMSCDLFQKTFCAEFPFDEADIPAIQEIEIGLEPESVIEEDLPTDEKIPVFTRFKTFVLPIVQTIKQKTVKIFNSIGIWIRKIYNKLVLGLRVVGSKIKATYHKIISSLKARKDKLNSPPQKIQETAHEIKKIKKNTEKKPVKPSPKPKSKTIIPQTPELKIRSNPTPYKTQKLQSFFSE
jgi:hypothetical protein